MRYDRRRCQRLSWSEICLELLESRHLLSAAPSTKGGAEPRWVEIRENRPRPQQQQQQQQLEQQQQQQQQLQKQQEQQQQAAARAAAMANAAARFASALRANQDAPAADPSVPQEPTFVPAIAVADTLSHAGGLTDVPSISVDRTEPSTGDSTDAIEKAPSTATRAGSAGNQTGNAGAHAQTEASLTGAGNLSVEVVGPRPARTSEMAGGPESESVAAAGRSEPGSGSASAYVQLAARPLAYLTSLVTRAPFDRSVGADDVALTSSASDGLAARSALPTKPADWAQSAEDLLRIGFAAPAATLSWARLEAFAALTPLGSHVGPIVATLDAGLDGLAAMDAPAAQGAGMLASFSPFDRENVERAIDEFLNSVGDMKLDGSYLSETNAVVPGVMAAVISVSLIAFARRRARCRWDRPVSEVVDEDSSAPGMPGLPGGWDSEEA